LIEPDVPELLRGFLAGNIRHTQMKYVRPRAIVEEMLGRLPEPKKRSRWRASW
jgi:hypothetical protein